MGWSDRISYSSGLEYSLKRQREEADCNGFFLPLIAQPTCCLQMLASIAAPVAVEITLVDSVLHVLQRAREYEGFGDDARLPGFESRP